MFLDVEDSLPTLCQLPNLHHLDISQCNESRGHFKQPTQFMETLVKSLHCLKSLDISGQSSQGGFKHFRESICFQAQIWLGLGVRGRILSQCSQCNVILLVWHTGQIRLRINTNARHALQMLALCFKLQFQHLSSGYSCYPCIQLANIYCYILGWTILLISLVCTRHTMRQAVGSTSQPDPFPVSLCR